MLPLVRMLGPGVDAQIAEQLAAKCALGEHAANRLLDREHRLAGDDVLERFAAKPSGIARVAVVELVAALVAGHGYLGSVDDHHPVAQILMRREVGAVLAAQNAGNTGGKPAERSTVRIGDIPASLHVARTYKYRFHRVLSPVAL